MQSYESVSKIVRGSVGRRRVWSYRDQPLPNEFALLNAVLVLRGCLLYDLLSSVTLRAGEIAQRYWRTINGITQVDVELYAQDWKEIKTSFLESLAVWKNQTFREWPCCFKRSIGGHIHYKWIWNTVAWMMEAGSSCADIVQWIVFDEKLNLRSLDLSGEMTQVYRDQEMDMRVWSYPDVSLAREIVNEWFDGFCLQLYPFRPRHGNGATAEVRRREAHWDVKNQFLVFDDELLAYVRRRDISNIDADYWAFGGISANANRVTRLQCVPKSMIKNRTISAEPTVLQFLQQDLFIVMDEMFQTTQIADHVDLHSQQRSASACLEASRDGSLASVDLSNASDSVTTSLLRALLEGTALDPLYDALMSVRSTEVQLPNGERLQLAKFGGMGNGTTFPVETLVFSLACEVATRLSSNRRKYFVYGDDILIDTEDYATLVAVLESWHFTVNCEKSFATPAGHCFREACGMWAYDGEDITPLRLSRRLFHAGLSTPQEAAGWIALYNECIPRGLLTLRQGLNVLLGETKWFRTIPRIALGSPAPRDSLCAVTFDGCNTDYHTKARAAWNFPDTRGGWQNVQHFCTVVRSEPRGSLSASQESSMFSWEVRTLHRDWDQDQNPASELSSLPAALVQRWARKWVPNN